MSICASCPRQCHIDRDNGKTGYCGVSNSLKIARCAKHMWEEPCISGKNGSGTIFFSGCNLGCVFCQNYEISHKIKGREVTDTQLEELMLRLEDEGAHNINLVTPSHYLETLIPILYRVKPKLSIPIVFNTGGYDSVEILKELDGLIDIYMPDFKYMSNELAYNYSKAKDYPEVAVKAIQEMHRQVPCINNDNNNLMQKGLIVRHLVLPGCRKDSMAVLDKLTEILPTSSFLLSLMSQYTPEFAMQSPYKNLHRRVTSFEYKSVLDYAISLGINGVCQERSSAQKSFTPDFDEITF